MILIIQYHISMKPCTNVVEQDISTHWTCLKHTSILRNFIIRAISTRIGTFKVGRSVQGIKTVPGIFHSVIDQSAYVTTYFDDTVPPWKSTTIVSSPAFKFSGKIIYNTLLFQENNFFCFFFYTENNILGLCNNTQ